MPQKQTDANSYATLNPLTLKRYCRGAYSLILYTVWIDTHIPLYTHTFSSFSQTFTSYCTFHPTQQDTQPAAPQHTTTHPTTQQPEHRLAHTHTPTPTQTPPRPCTHTHTHTHTHTQTPVS